MPQKYLRNFRGLLKIPVSNGKVELKVKWTKYFVLSSAGNDNTNANIDNIIFTKKGAKLYISLVTLSAKDNHKISKLLSKGFVRSVYGNEYVTKSENKNTRNEYR